MSTYFSLIKGKGLDSRTIGDELTEDQVRKILLRSRDECMFQVTEWYFYCDIGDVCSIFIDCLNGEEWLNNHL